jgi:hypothetical protein
MFYASHVQAGFDLFYWHCIEDDDFNTFEFRKVDIRSNMEDHEVVKSVQCKREDTKYHALGVVMNKPLTKFTTLNVGVDESRVPKEL